MTIYRDLKKYFAGMNNANGYIGLMDLCHSMNTMSLFFFILQCHNIIPVPIALTEDALLLCSLATQCYYRREPETSLCLLFLHNVDISFEKIHTSEEK